MSSTRSALALALVLVAACGPAEAPAQAPRPAESAPLPAGLAPARFLLGAWASPTESERWSFAGQSLVGVGFTVKDGRTRNFEVMFVQEHEGALRFVAMPDGARSVPFALRDQGDARATFANPAHDFPRRITYRREGSGLAARIEDDARGVDFAYAASAVERAPALEAADLAFAADTSARGVEGWVSWFDREGAMWRPEGRVEGAPAIRAAMTKTLGDPSRRLTWRPLTSGLSRAGDVGFTVGAWTLLRVGDAGAPAPQARGAYVTLWRAQPDGSFKVLFDTGEPG